MDLNTLKPLRVTIAGLGLFAAAVSAQGQLLVTFLEDTEKGHLSVIFSGQSTALFNVTESSDLSVTAFEPHYVVTAEGNAESPIYHSNESNWIYQDQLPLTGAYTNPIFTSGTGGFFHNGSAFQVISPTAAPIGQQVTWDAIITYVGNLAGIGLSEGDSGTLVFTNGSDTFTIDWDTAVVVPEPATYAVILGLGVAGIALLRRRTSRR